MVKRRLWTNEEDQYLVVNIQDLTYEEMAQELDRTVIAVNERRKVLGLLKVPIYAYYIGDDYQREGTKEELAEFYGVKPETILWYAANKKQKQKRRIKVVRV